VAWLRRIDTSDWRISCVQVVKEEMKVIIVLALWDFGWQDEISTLCPNQKSPEPIAIAACNSPVLIYVANQWGRFIDKTLFPINLTLLGESAILNLSKTIWKTIQIIPSPSTTFHGLSYRVRHNLDALNYWNNSGGNDSAETPT
jgi:hypothetical protein